MNKKRIVNLTTTSAIFVFIMSFGIIGFMYIENFTFVDALYTTIITFSTVGYEMPQHIYININFIKLWGFRVLCNINI